MKLLFHLFSLGAFFYVIAPSPYLNDKEERFGPPFLYVTVHDGKSCSLS
jgi:hypothetical protein